MIKIWDDESDLSFSVDSPHKTTNTLRIQDTTLPVIKEISSKTRLGKNKSIDLTSSNFHKVRRIGADAN